MLCKCGKKMTWLNRMASTSYFECFNCHRKAEEYNGDSYKVTWWAVEMIETAVHREVVG